MALDSTMQREDFMRKTSCLLLLMFFVLFPVVHADTDFGKVYCCVKGCGG